MLDSVCLSDGEISLPVQGSGQWSLLHTSPLLPLLAGQLRLSLLGEMEKINPVSPVRLISLQAGKLDLKKDFFYIGSEMQMNE